jgi:diaminopimelate decarboxylase
VRRPTRRAPQICISSQELDPRLFPAQVALGVRVNACSLSQLEAYGRAFPGTDVGVRFNPGLGSGGTGKTNVGGPDSSFGIWHESAPAVAEVAALHGLRVVRVHTHIGSGSDPAVWQRTAGLSLQLVRPFPQVTTLNLGGGYKVARMATEKGTDMAVVGAPVRDAFVAFANETGRKARDTLRRGARATEASTLQLHLVIEPGTFLLANSCSLVSTVQDVVSTSTRSFLKLDTGMTEVLRPSLCAPARHSRHAPALLTALTATARNTLWCWSRPRGRRRAGRRRSAHLRCGRLRRRLRTSDLAPGALEVCCGRPLL